MSCSVPEDVPNPQCSIHFKTEAFDVRAGSIRRGELDHLDQIMANTRAFVAPLGEAADITEGG